MTKKLSLIGLGIFLSVFGCGIINEVAAAKREVPRFVSLRSNEIRMRFGPGKEYPVKWILKRKGLPVKIIAEFDTWRQIECSDQTKGWVHQSLLTGRRNLMVTVDSCKLRSSADSKSRSVAVVKKDALLLVKITDCKDGNCYVKVGGIKGWVSKKAVWGLLTTE